MSQHIETKNKAGAFNYSKGYNEIITERAFLEVKFFEFCLKQRMNKSAKVKIGLSDEERLSEDLLESQDEIKALTKFLTEIKGHISARFYLLAMEYL